jgi:hypothetical protein
VLADPGGDAFCVIEPGNGFLADPDGNEFRVAMSPGWRSGPYAP